MGASCERIELTMDISDWSPMAPRTRCPLSPCGRGWRAKRAGRGGFRPGGFKRVGYHFHHGLGIFQDIIIPEAQNPKPLALQPLITTTVGRAVGVLTSVRLDDDFPIEADEIEDVAPDRNLALELVSAETVCTQKIPKPPFGIGHLRSQPLGLDKWHAPSPGSLRSPPSPTRGEGNR